MAYISSGVACSHVPALGVASDTGIADDDYYGPIFKGFEYSKQWIAEEKPDVIFMVYNDHCTAFDATVIPTFALGCATEYQPADEGWGPRPVPVVKGHQALSAHIAQALVLDMFDITVINQMEVDHGLTVPLTMMFGQPDDGLVRSCHWRSMWFSIRRRWALGAMRWVNPYVRQSSHFLKILKCVYLVPEV